MDLENNKENDITEDDLKKAKKLRRKTRLSVSKALSRLTKRMHQHGVTYALLVEWHDDLFETDELLGKDEQSSTYFEKLDAMGKILNELQPAATNNVETQSQTAAQPSIRTTVNRPKGPKIEMETFSGKVSEFVQYDKMFDLHVDQTDAELSTKFLALRKYFGKHVHHLLVGLDCDSDGYIQARKRIREHYLSGSKVRVEAQQRFAQVRTIQNVRNIKDLKKLYEIAIETYSSLKHINTGSEYMDETFFNLIARKMPIEWLREFRSTAHPQQVKILIDFIKKKLDEEDWLSEIIQKDLSNNKEEAQINLLESPTNKTSDKLIKCSICEESHKTFQCRNGTAESRRQAAMEKRLCFRCLRPGHRSCKSTFICSCGAPHSSSVCLHRDRIITQNSSVSNENESTQVKVRSNNMERLQELASSSNASACNTTNEKPSPSSTIAHINSNNNSFSTFYKTCLVRINKQLVRIILDDGAGRSIIRSEVAERLQLPVVGQQHLSVKGPFGGGESNSEQLIAATLESITNNEKLDVVLSVVNKLAPLRFRSIDQKQFENLTKKGFLLTDVCDPLNPLPIDIIIGLEYAGQIWKSMEQRVSTNLYIRESIFGHICFGTTTQNDEDGSYNMLISFSDQRKVAACKKDEVKQFIEDFKKNNVKFNGEYYVVNLPQKEPIVMKNNRENAWRRFTQLIANLKRRKFFPKWHENLSIDVLARLMLLKQIQEKHFEIEIETIKNKEILKFSKLKKYSLILDEFGILRLRTRLKKLVNLTYEQKFSAILPDKCSIVEAIIQTKHSSLHGGGDRIRSLVRERYFVLKLKILVKRIRKKLFDLLNYIGIIRTVETEHLTKFKKKKMTRRNIAQRSVQNILRLECEEESQRLTSAGGEVIAEKKDSKSGDVQC